MQWYLNITLNLRCKIVEKYAPFLVKKITIHMTVSYLAPLSYTVNHVRRAQAKFYQIKGYRLKFDLG